MYSLDDYLAMVRDDLRTPAYLEAMAAVIRPGDRVLDLGTGFGYFAVHACRMGAGHVWAIEPSDAIAMGPSFAAANGYADRITFLQRLAAQVTLPERADVLIEDLRGLSPLHGERLDVLRDVTARLLVPRARRIPLSDELRIAPAELPADLRDIGADAPTELHGITVGPVLDRQRQAVQRTHAGASVLLADGATWAKIDLAALPLGDPDGSVEWIAERAGRLAGLVSWFRTTLAPGIGFETAPSSGRSVYDRGFLPVGAPVDVLQGDRITARIRTRHDGSDYVWAWNLVVERGGNRIAERRCSNVATRAMSARRRAARAADHRPSRSPVLEQVATLVGSVNGHTPLVEIAQRLRSEHPLAFPSEQDALRWAGELLARLDEDPPR